MSLRTVEQAIHRLGLLLASLRDDRRAFLPTSTFALILRTIDPDLYRRFVDGKATDEEVANTMFERFDEGYRYSHEGNNLELEILSAAFEIQCADRETSDETGCPLLRKYRRVAQADNDSHGQTDRERNHASVMIAFFDKQQQNRFFRQTPPAFRNSVARLELLSSDLANEESPSVES